MQLQVILRKIIIQQKTKMIKENYLYELIDTKIFKLNY